jgi:hypothetical protein
LLLPVSLPLLLVAGTVVRKPLSSPLLLDEILPEDGFELELRARVLGEGRRASFTGGGGILTSGGGFKLAWFCGSAT